MLKKIAKGLGGYALLFLIVACTPKPVPIDAPPTVDNLSVADLVAGHWLSSGERYLCRHSGVLDLPWRDVPLQGVIRIDTRLNEARLVAMDSMGVKLFDLSMSADTETVHYLLPLFQEQPRFVEVVGDSVRRIFLSPQPQRTDCLQERDSRQPYRLTSPTERGCSFVFDGDPVSLRRTSCDNQSSPWQVDYRSYKAFGTVWAPTEIVLTGDHYRLTLWVEEVRLL